MVPLTSGSLATAAAHSMARSRIKRYITVLTIFSAASDRQSSEQGIEWASFPFKSEYSELRDAGYIKGDIGMPCDVGGGSSGPAEIFMCGITVSGVMKLAELSEFLSRTSLSGRIILSLVQLGWLLVGVLIGTVVATMSGTSVPK